MTYKPKHRGCPKGLHAWRISRSRGWVDKGTNYTKDVLVTEAKYFCEDCGDKQSETTYRRRFTLTAYETLEEARR